MIEFKSKSTSWIPMLMLFGFKTMRGGGLLIGNHFMNTLSFSLINFVFFVLLIATPITLFIAKPKFAELWKKKWALISHSFLFITNLFLWCVGLKYFGAIKTILAFDYGSILLSQIMYQIGDSNKQDLEQMKGIFCMTASYILLLFIDIPTQSSTQTLQEVLQSPGQVEGFSLVFGVAEKKLGAMAVFLCLVVELFRKSISKKLTNQLGGQNQLIAGSSVISFVIVTVLTIFYPLFASSNSNFEINYVRASFFEEFLGILFFAVFVFVGDHIVEPLVRTKLKKPILVTLPSVAFSYLAVFFIEWWNGTNNSSFITFLSFFLVLAGIYFVYQNQDRNLDNLPIYGSTIYSPSKSPVFHFLKNSIYIIWKDSKSRNIFIFLCTNLVFMVVEMIYGFISNSLGLISDAFHMLFDCTALGIGLYASIISKWEANGSFSYGFSRVEILSGFVNGVFLLFIGFFVLIESLQRLVEPPEVKSERLVLVSVMGFVVNMIGLYAFHDHSGHGHSHGSHGHSHGHSHSKEKKLKDDHGHSHSEKKKNKHDDHKDHGHSHSHKEKKKSKHEDHDDHGHSHSHSEKKNKHDDHDDHGHGHSHSHSHRKNDVFLVQEKKLKDEHSHSHSKKNKHDDHDDHSGHGHSHSHRKNSILMGEHDDENPHDHHDHDNCDEHDHSHSINYKNEDSNYSKKFSDLSFDLDEVFEKESGDNHYEDENMKGIFLHVLADTLGSVGVIISSCLVYWFDWKIADAICSAIISVMILLSTIPLLKSTASTLLQGSPKHLRIKLRNGLRNILKIKNILNIRNPHFWTLAGENVIGSIDIVIDSEGNDQVILSKVSSILTDVGVTNLTIQIDRE